MHATPPQLRKHCQQLVPAVRIAPACAGWPQHTPVPALTCNRPLSSRSPRHLTYTRSSRLSLMRSSGSRTVVSSVIPLLVQWSSSSRDPEGLLPSLLASQQCVPDVGCGDQTRFSHPREGPGTQDHQDLIYCCTVLCLCGARFKGLCTEL
jgi:hypothetical protein